MMRWHFVLALLWCSAASAQSIVVSGDGRSIVASGVANSAPAPPPQDSPFQEISPAEREIEQLKREIALLRQQTKPVEQPKPVETSRAPARVTQRFLVTTPGCPACPPAKSRFLAAGNPPQNIISPDEALRRFGRRVTYVPYEFTAEVTVSGSQPAAPVRSTVRQRLPVVRTQWGTIDLETYQRNCNCPMCQSIRAMQQQYRMQSSQIVPELPAGQQPTPRPVIDRMLSAMRLGPSDVLADIGCGDGRILIAAVQRYGCHGVGVEIDATQAERAREAVEAAGLSGRIQIITGDAREFRPADYGVTAATAYLFPDLLKEIAPSLRGLRVVASPYHEIPGLGMRQQDDVWLTGSSPAIPGFDREAEISHLLDPSTQHAGKFTREQLDRMSEMQLIDLHNREHGVLTVDGVRVAGRN